MFEKHTILGVHITDRLKEAVEVQRILTQHGNQVKTRLGLHEIDEAGRSGKNGLMILEMVGPDEGIQQMVDKLNGIEGIEVQSMVFSHSE